jgi:hypothetical protein
MKDSETKIVDSFTFNHQPGIALKPTTDLSAYTKWICNLPEKVRKEKVKNLRYLLNYFSTD